MKKMGYHLTRGLGKPSKSEGEGVDATLFSFKKTLFRHFEKYLHNMMLKLTEHVEITIFLLYKQKTRWNSDIQNFCSEILNFRLFFAKNRNFQVRHVFYDVITT